MRILIFSDLHGNLESLHALQQVETKPAELIFLGDAVGFGPDPSACLAWLRRNANHIIQGDHDRAVATGADCLSPSEWIELAHATRDLARIILPHREQSYLNTLPCEELIEIQGVRFWMTHHIPDSLNLLTASEATIAKQFENVHADIILFGHTHVPLLRYVNRTWFVNPGSLGQPCHGLPSATYAVWDDGELKIQHIDYDPRPTIQKLALLPLDPDHIARLQDTLAHGM